MLPQKVKKNNKKGKILSEKIVVQWEDGSQTTEEKSKISNYEDLEDKFYRENLGIYQEILDHLAQADEAFKKAKKLADDNFLPFIFNEIEYQPSWIDKRYNEVWKVVFNEILKDYTPTLKKDDIGWDSSGTIC